MKTGVTEDLLGIPISTRTMSETIQTIRNWIGADKPRQIATANLDFLRMARSNTDLLSCLREADMVTADGMPLLWLARLKGHRIKERVAGSDMMKPLFDAAAQEGWRIYFLGGAKGTAKAAAKKAVEEFPNLQVAGAESPMVDLEDIEKLGQIVQRIRDARCELLFVGLGCPKQEFFLRDHLAQTGAKVGIGVGGSFDFIAGSKSRAPKILRMLGLEWGFRWLQEPRRLSSRYLRNIAILPLLAATIIRNRIQLGVGVQSIAPPK
ncbi:MAG: N-acetylglucosaminyldiphosphoundecaprenol N-acetyl-beta-D-mannosaminyltransferase [Planctomycetota bacterium]|jgi:N-acetylglucosaminyldiphosphoundecaprenol N-acetyl-beta-D-mannosaminyltransferase